MYYLPLYIFMAILIAVKAREIVMGGIIASSLRAFSSSMCTTPFPGGGRTLSLSLFVSSASFYVCIKPY